MFVGMAMNGVLVRTASDCKFRGTQWSGRDGITTPGMLLIRQPPAFDRFFVFIETLRGQRDAFMRFILHQRDGHRWTSTGHQPVHRLTCPYDLVTIAQMAHSEARKCHCGDC